MMLAFALFFLTILSGLPSLDTLPTAPEKEFLIVIDAGSSGSRIHIFSFTRENSEPGSIPQFHLPQQTKKEKPGLSSFESNTSDAGESLTGLINFAKENIPQKQWKNTKLILGATAGLRRLTPEKAQKILDDVAEYLREHSPFELMPDYPKLLSGDMEGSLGWLAANYLMGNIDGANGKKPTTTVVEMGGASSQVTSALENEADEKLKRFPLTVGKSLYNLYTHSYLNFGQDAARESYNVKLTGPSIIDPCLPKAYSSKKHSQNSVYSGPKHAEEIQGSGNFAECKNVVATLFDKNAPCEAKKCSFGGISQPKLDDREILTFENLFYTAEGMGLLDEFTVEALEEKGTQFCATSWEELVKKHSQEDAERWCFAAAYAANFLERGLDVPKNKKIKVKKSINNANIDWALGLAVLSASQLEAIGNNDNALNNDITMNVGADDLPFARWIIGFCLLFGVLAIVFTTLHRFKGRQVFSAVPLDDIGRADLKSV